MDKQQALNVSPIVLAFVGDAVYSLFVRERLTFETDYKAGEMQKLSISEVNAVAQANFVKEIMPLLTEEELGVFKRARNAKKGTKAKSASVADYNSATGFEALLGLLYYRGDFERIERLMSLSFKH